jgi:hypothetical protein
MKSRRKQDQELLGSASIIRQTQAAEVGPCDLLIEGGADGPRDMTVERLMSYHVVLTTYEVVSFS